MATYVDGLPDHRWPEIGVIQGLVDEQAPGGELRWHARAATLGEYRADLADVLAHAMHSFGAPLCQGRFMTRSVVGS